MAVAVWKFGKRPVVDVAGSQLVGKSEEFLKRMGREWRAARFGLHADRLLAFAHADRLLAVERLAPSGHVQMTPCSDSSVPAARSDEKLWSRRQSVARATTGAEFPRSLLLAYVLVALSALAEHRGEAGFAVALGVRRRATHDLRI